MPLRDIISVYSSGLCELLLSALGAALILGILLQGLAEAAGGTVETRTVLPFVWQSIVFLALWPGQQVWTIQRKTAAGHVHSIIGVPSDDDLRVLNHRAARRHRPSRSD